MDTGQEDVPGIENTNSESNHAPTKKKKDAPDVTTAKFKVSQVKRQVAQRNAFTRWVNSKISNGPDSQSVTDLFLDLRDGNVLLSLLEVLTGKKTGRVKGKLRLHKLNNVNVALDFLKEYKVKLVNIGNTDIVDGVPIPTLGLIWSIIYRFQIQGALLDILPGDKSSGEKDAETAILEWCAKAVEGYEGVDIKNFSTSWKDGLAFNALIHRYKPNLFHYESFLTKPPTENLDHAFAIAETAFGVHKLLEPTDFQRDPIDSRLVVMYVSTLYEKLKELDPKPDDTVSLEEIEELKSFINTELQFLKGCEDFFANCSSSTDDCDVIDEYRDLIDFIENLQPHQVKVGELVHQIEYLIRNELIPTEESNDVENNIEELKSLWQSIFDQTSQRQDRLRRLVLAIVDRPLKDADSRLTNYREKLKDFLELPRDVGSAWDQYQKFLAYIDELRDLESRIEEIRTGEVGNEALTVLSDEDEQIATENIKELIDNFMNLGEDVADAKYRLTENFYETLMKEIDHLHDVIRSAENVTSNDDINNNEAGTDISERLKLYQNLLSRLNGIKDSIDLVSHVCQKLDENFDVDGIDLEELKQDSASLDKNCYEQISLLEHLLEQNFFKRNLEQFLKRLDLAYQYSKVFQAMIPDPLIHGMVLMYGKDVRRSLFCESYRSVYNVIPYLSQNMDENHNENHVLKVTHSRNIIVSSFNEEPGEGNMKKLFKRSKKHHKSRSSPSRSSNVSRTESERSSYSERSDFEDGSSSHVVEADAAEKQLKNRQSEILDDWAHKLKRTLSFVEIASGRIQLIRDLTTWKQNNNESDSLEAEFSQWEETVNETVQLGKNLFRDSLLDQDAKASVRRDTEKLQARWKSIKEDKDQALVHRDRLPSRGWSVDLSPSRSIAQDQLVSQGKFDSWKKDFEEKMVWIKEKEKELDSMDDLESSLIMLEDAATKIESLYAEISNYQEKIDSVVEVGSKIIHENEVDSSAIPSIRADIRSLESTWELLREKCSAIQLNIQEKVTLKQAQEKQFMAEWRETHIKVDDWLTNAENEASLFDKAREQIIDVEDQVAEHEELVFRLATEEKTINDLLEVGEILAKEKISQTENKLTVKNELKSLKKRKTKLNARLVGQQESLTSYLDYLARIEGDEFETWLHKCKNVEKEILRLEKEENSVGIDSVDGAKTNCDAEEVFISEIEAIHEDVDDVAQHGEDLISSGKMGKLKRQSIRSGTKSLQDLYKKKKDAAKLRLKELQEELAAYQQKLQEQMQSWINKAEMFNRWIDHELKDLEALFNNFNEDDTIEKILQIDHAVREIKSNTDSRTSILDALINEGETLKADNGIKQDKPEEYEKISKLLESTNNDWSNLNNAINENLERVMNMLSGKQSQLLAVCLEQIGDLEKNLKALGPVSDGFDTLAYDAEIISDTFMIVGQVKANVVNFDRYVNDLQNSEDFSNSKKFELRESNEILKTRMHEVEIIADERKFLIHDKIIDVLTESLVVLSDTVSNLQEKCDEMVVPDSLDNIDLVEKHAALEDILQRLNACEVSLKDIENLGNIAESCMILESDEPDDIKAEIERRKTLIKQVQQMAREMKSRIYGLLVYTFKQRTEELDEMLTKIEGNSKQEEKIATDLQTVMEKIRRNEASLGELDDCQKHTEDISMQINEIVDSNALLPSDEKEIKEKCNNLIEHMPEVYTTLKLQNNNLRQTLESIIGDKLDQLQEWLNMMAKRRDGDNPIGPDSMTIKKQISEMNVIESQLREKRLTPHLHYNDDIATGYLDPATLEDLKEADNDWLDLSDWINTRTKTLHACQEAWERFRQHEVDLLDYLRDKEKQIKNWEPINLEDENAVADRLAQLKGILSAMEQRKDDVDNLHEVADDVIDLIGSETPMANNIRSQVADIHDCWNKTVRLVIEAISKLNFAKEKLQTMEEGINEIRDWLADAQSILKFYTDDIPDDVMEDLKPQVEQKCEQEPSKRCTLNKVNSLSRELLDDIDGPSHDIIHADVKNLNKEWQTVTSDLEKKKDMKKRPCCWWCYRRWFLKYGYYN